MESGACVCVVLASGGYPQHYEKGKAITVGDLGDAFLYHAGTKRENGVLKTNGGRVLNVCAKGKTVAEARKKAMRRLRTSTLKASSSAPTSASNTTAGCKRDL